MGLVLSLVHPSGSQVVLESLQGIQEEGEREERAPPHCRSDPACPAPTLPLNSSILQQPLAKEIMASPAIPSAPYLGTWHQQMEAGIGQVPTHSPSSALGDIDQVPPLYR